MAKEKFTHSSKNKQRLKKSLLCLEEKSKKTMKTGKKQGKKSNSELDVDSLEYLRDTKKRNKLIDVDEKIKLLKAELMTMFSDKTIDNIDIDNKMIDSKTSELIPESDFTESEENSQIDKKIFEPVFVSTPAKFPEEIKKTTKTKIFIDTEEQNSKNLLSSFKSTENNLLKTAKFDASSLTQEKIEELIYRSFIKQKSKLIFSLDDESDSECRESTKKDKLHRFKKQFKNKSDRYIQQNLNKYCISTQGGEKRRRIDLDSLDSDVEVIDLDTSSHSDVKSKSNSVCLDFDIEDYNWSEPFLIDIEDPSLPKTTSSCGNNEIEEVTLNNTGVQKTSDKTIIKNVWECPICFEVSKGQEVVTTRCGHIFCKKCVESHFSKLGKNCPSCRMNLKNKPLITLFNF